MGKKEQQGYLGRDPTEKEFSIIAQNAGFEVRPPRSIRCEKPVRVKGRQKTVTTPDFEVIDPETGKRGYVEVTKGNGQWPSKKAQRLVAERAGIENYVQITGEGLERLKRAEPGKRKELLEEMIRWKK